MYHLIYSLYYRVLLVKIRVFRFTSNIYFHPFQPIRGWGSGCRVGRHIKSGFTGTQRRYPPIPLPPVSFSIFVFNYRKTTNKQDKKRSMGLYPTLFQAIPSFFRLHGNPRDSSAGKSTITAPHTDTPAHASRQTGGPHTSRCTGQHQQLPPLPRQKGDDGGYNHRHAPHHHQQRVIRGSAADLVQVVRSCCSRRKPTN